MENTIGRANLDGSGANASFISVGGSSDSLFGLAVDSAHVFWADQDPNAIGRANLNGSGANPTFVTNGVNGPAGVTVDSAHLYFANNNTGAIARVNLDGSGDVNTGFIPGGNSPYGVAVDGGHVYWTNFGTGTIGRADLDGTNANQSFITGASTVLGLAVDSAHIYWANGSVGAGLGTIGRANLNGSGVNQSFITGTRDPSGVAVDAAHIYWTRAGINGAGAIGRANLNGSGVNQSFITGLNNPTGLAVDALPASPGTTTSPGAVAGPLPLPTVAVRPSISTLFQSHPVFKVGLRSTPVLGRTTRSVPRGTTFSFRLNEPAVVLVRIQRKLPGRRVGRVCRPPSRLLRFRPRCTRLVLKATLRRTARVGLNRIAFSGRIRGHALPAGYYRAAFIAANSAGTSALRALNFRIVAG